MGTCGGDGISFGCFVRARGRAVGPYPGTFFAHCVLSESSYHLHPFWNFTEHFIIRSGASKIIGTISAGGNGSNMPIPGVYQYTTTIGYSRNVKIQSLGGKTIGPDADFREAFDGL